MHIEDFAVRRNVHAQGSRGQGDRVGQKRYFFIALDIQWNANDPRIDMALGEKNPIGNLKASMNEGPDKKEEKI